MIINYFNKNVSKIFKEKQNKPPNFKWSKDLNKKLIEDEKRT
jgi:hypothetical protein